ncbi:MAG: Tol biopolymer transport system component/dienelactone hydrolase [Saprospiraceae bacterium]|jgi:Tol biopolymer transport system component/dienelactone hydrolase
MKQLSTTFLLFFTLQIFAQNVENKSVLTIAQIMQGEKFIGYSPTNISWSDDSKTVYFDWNPDDELLRSKYKITVDNPKNIEKVSIEELKAMSHRGDWNKAYLQKIYSHNGDIFLFNLQNGTTKQITNTLENEYYTFFSEDEKSIVYTKNNNIFLWNIENGTTTQITDFQDGNKKRKSSKPEYQEWLYEDQLQYFEVLRARKIKRELRTQQRDTLRPERPLTIHYGKKRLSNIFVSNDLNFVTFRLTKPADGKGTDYMDYVTETGYANNRGAREKVGTPQETYEMGIYDRNRDTFYMIDVEQIEGIYDKPAYMELYHKDTAAYNSIAKNPRSVIIHNPIYSPNGKHALLDIRAMDNKDRWLVNLDLATGKMTQLNRQHDDAWIGGPGIGGWDYYPGNMGWITNNEFFYQSEETGFSHLYGMNIKTKIPKQLTEGKFEILEAKLSKDKKSFWITSNKETPHEHHFYKLSANGGKMKKITSQKGGNEISISPDENWLAIRHSTSNQPWELLLMKNEAGETVTQITNSTTDNFQKYDWRKPEIIKFTAEDGAKVPARIYKPKNPNGAAVVFVHGAGYLQNVHEWWSTYYREYMFHNILTDNGYTVLDIDYRASEGYGRDWRTAIYRHMGGKDLSDHTDGAKYLVAEYGIDSARVGIYGGSYGGFITLMAMFNEPETFKSGAAIRSVTDWAHYNHPYTNNILNVPATDSMAYRQSSPIYFAEGLEGNLLILHGMIDNNVQFQDVVRLSQRLIELGKEDWEMAIYPVEAHGFKEPSSWTDEYKRIFKLFQTTIGN